MVSITNPYHGFDGSCSKRIGQCHTPRDTQSIGSQPHQVETPLRQSDEQAITSLRRLIGSTESRKRMQQWWSRTNCNHGRQLHQHRTSAVSQKRFNRRVRISTCAMVGIRGTANAVIFIDDHNQQHTNPLWSASQTRIAALIAAAANV
jgi:hypothetical protein